VQRVADEFQHCASAFSYDSGEVNGEENSLETIETRKPTAEMPDDGTGVGGSVGAAHSTAGKEQACFGA
jgi:hypothetical protein